MKLRYRCLLVDHDDTAVDSTPSIHHPAHLEALRILRPARTPPTLEQWFELNLDPGIGEYLLGDLALDRDEMAVAVSIWRRWTSTVTPRFYPGFREVLAEFRDAGGRFAVISHSNRDVIETNYRDAGEPALLPDAVFGWDDEPERRKPNPWPAREAMRLLRTTPAETLVLDDLLPGALMARACGAHAAAVGWAHRLPRIERRMRETCDFYLPTVESLRSLLLPG